MLCSAYSSFVFWITRIISWGWWLLNCKLRCPSDYLFSANTDTSWSTKPRATWLTLGATIYLAICYILSEYEFMQLKIDLLVIFCKGKNVQGLYASLCRAYGVLLVKNIKFIMSQEIVVCTFLIITWCPYKIIRFRKLSNLPSSTPKQEQLRGTCCNIETIASSLREDLSVLIMVNTGFKSCFHLRWKCYNKFHGLTWLMKYFLDTCHVTRRRSLNYGCI
jgi:hypothetical protein